MTIAVCLVAAIARLQPRAILPCRTMTSGSGEAIQVATHRAAGSRILVKDVNRRRDAQLALATSDIAELSTVLNWSCVLSQLSRSPI